MDGQPPRLDNGSGHNSARVTEGPNKKEAAEKLARTGRTLRELGFDSESEPLPEIDDEAMDIIHRYAQRPRFRSESVYGGDRFLEMGEYQVFGLSVPTNKRYNDEGEVVEADIAPAILVEDETGYGIWSEDPSSLNTEDNEDNRLNSENLRYSIKDDDELVAFDGNPVNSGSVLMSLHKYGQDSGGIQDQSVINRMEESLKRKADFINGVEYDGRRVDGGDEGDIVSFDMEVSVEGAPEEVADRLETVYMAIQEERNPRSWR